MLQSSASQSLNKIRSVNKLHVVLTKQVLLQPTPILKKLGTAGTVTLGKIHKIGHSKKSYSKVSNNKVIRYVTGTEMR
jgi:hypothetical protein